MPLAKTIRQAAWTLHLKPARMPRWGAGWASAPLGVRQLIGRVAAALAAVAAAGIMTGIASFALVWSLQNAVPPPEQVARQTAVGIIVMGGGLSSFLVAIREGRTLVGPAERVSAGLALADRMSEARILFTGEGEADPTTALTSRGIAPSRLLLETRSTSTAENARYSARLVGAASRGRWVVVTSAYHMPRALACLRAAGFDAVPHAVGYERPWNVAFWPRAWVELASLVLYDASAVLGAVLPPALSRSCARDD